MLYSYGMNEEQRSCALCFHCCMSLGLYSNNYRVTDSATLAGYRFAAKSLLVWL